jgi:hypothetical protein
MPKLQYEISVLLLNNIALSATLFVHVFKETNYNLETVTLW